jgi:hypothetical protein
LLTTGWGLAHLPNTPPLGAGILYRLLDQDMLAGLERLPGDSGVEGGWHAGQHGVAGDPLQSLGEAQEAALGRNTGASGKGSVGGGSRVDMGHGLDCSRVRQDLLGPVQAPEAEPDLHQPQPAHEAAPFSVKARA